MTVATAFAQLNKDRNFYLFYILTTILFLAIIAYESYKINKYIKCSDGYCTLSSKLM